MGNPRLLSTTALAGKLGMEKKALFALLESSGLIRKDASGWVLTPEGEVRGGGYIDSKDFGRYVGWPEDFQLQPERPDTPQPSAGDGANLLTATSLGNHFGLSANKCNYILSELGWVKKGLRGWQATEQGLRLGAKQSEDYRSGVPYVRWPESILSHTALQSTIGEVKGTATPPVLAAPTQVQQDDFRERFPATYRAADGHMVRSRAEMLIDNWLYMAEIVHAYERKLPVEEDVYCDFYIPTGKVYIEFWGMESEPRYRARMDEKKAVYKKYGFNLIELGDADVQNLDDILPRRLLKHGVQAY